MIVKVYENLHFPGEAFQMANALFALIPEARLRGVMGALHRFSDLPLRLLDAEGKPIVWNDGDELNGML